MSKAIRKADLFVRLGYDGCHELLEAALEREGLSRPEKTGISPRKVKAVRVVLARRFVRVCPRGDCQAEAAGIADGRTVVPASTQGECAMCGGSANRRAVDEMVEALQDAGLDRLCVVGGSPNARVELERLVDGRLKLRLVPGATARTLRQAQADLAWADRIAIWGGTILDHKVSVLYRGPNVVRFARRSIQELAREVSISVSAPQ